MYSKSDRDKMSKTVLVMAEPNMNMPSHLLNALVSQERIQAVLEIQVSSANFAAVSLT